MWIYSNWEIIGAQEVENDVMRKVIWVPGRHGKICPF